MSRKLKWKASWASMDCKIDGVLTDVKSTSSFGFKKFKEATLAFDDPFGYIDQIKAYAH